MSTIRIRRQHALGRATARQRVEALAQTLHEKLDADYNWQGDRLLFKRSGASGAIDVSDDSIDVQVDLKLLLRPMKGSIQQTIEEYLDRELA